MINHIQYKTQKYHATYVQISWIVVLWMHYNRILTNITYALNTQIICES